MARTPIELLRADLLRLGEELNNTKSQMMVYRSLATSLLAVHRLDPEHGEQRLAVLREMALQALPLPEEKSQYEEWDLKTLALFTEIFESVEYAIRVVGGGERKN